MTKSVFNQDQLVSEIERLGRRLAATEEALRAVRAGQADALVIERPDRRQLFTLAGADQSYRVLIEEMTEGAATLAPDATILYSNRRFAEILRRPVDRVIGEDIRTFIEAGGHDQFRHLFEQARQGRSGGEIVILTEDGGTVPMLFAMGPLPGDAPSAISLVATDISEQKRAEARLLLAASVFTHAREGIVIADAHNQVIELNDTFCEITGFCMEHLAGRAASAVFTEACAELFHRTILASLADKGQWRGEVWCKSQKNPFPAFLTASAVKDSHGNIRNYVFLFTDITEIKAHESRLEYIAHYDQLTGLPNRVLLADRLKLALTHCQRHGGMVATVYLDLDGFKAVNDRYGHAAGDELLVEVANRMRASLRESDTLARVGGDEFVAILGDLDGIGTCDAILKRMQDAIGRPILQQSRTVHVSSSIGVTFYPQDRADADILLRHADYAMYLAKQAGKNCTRIFDVNQSTRIKVSAYKENDIRRALGRNELFLLYQPKVNMRTGAVIGAEALIRWRHPVRGVLAPAAFLPMITDRKLTVDLGSWVIDAALAQLLDWQSQGFELPVSINVDADQLEEQDFVLSMQERLRKLGIRNPRLIEFEMLESCAIRDLESISRLMRKCRDIGFTFALDDFGTSYSSLSYLKRLPADTIKIDKSFVLNMLRDPEDRLIVEGVVSLAAAFHRRVIAEGVETTEHGSTLLQIGCELAQGYGIARPMPGGELPLWSRQWRTEAAWQGSPA